MTTSRGRGGISSVDEVRREVLQVAVAEPALQGLNIRRRKAKRKKTRTVEIQFANT
jgi:hypothetical protein